MSDLARWIPRLAGRRVVVVGDVFLDEYLVGRANRLSREAPIPVLEFESRAHIPGGAANPAVNIAALGGWAAQVGVLGDDHAADSLRAALEGLGVDVSGLVVDSTRPTTVKLRVMASSGLRFPQQLARLDTLSRQPISAAVEAQVLAQTDILLKRKRNKPHALLLSDYQTGLLTPTLVEALRERGTAAKLLLTADSQGHFEKYAGFGVVKCNADEAREYLRRDLHTADEFAAAAVELRRALGLTRAMVITRGNAGATVATPEAVTHHPAPAVSDVYDTVGAGDTTIAVLTLAVSAGASVGEAAQLANYASGLVIRKVGNYAPKPEELAWALRNFKNGDTQGDSHG